MVKGGSPGATYLKDYTQPDYLIDHIDLTFELKESATVVTAKTQFRKNHSGNQGLVLNGSGLILISLSIDGRLLSSDDYSIDGEELTISTVPENFELIVVNQLDPKGNKSLEGLYQSSGIYCTQCEAEGFRKITWYLDRPDVMALFTTTIIAESNQCSAMLSNGNLVEKGTLEDGRAWVKWEDPFKKPCYLFALVAGNLKCIEDKFTTASGREVLLQIWVEPGNIDKCDHAMRSLIKAMQWDEQVYGLEYDLDIYMIVAVNDFNMGAMENKGLNVFNSKYVLALPETATDADFLGIESVIAHEYFHNWTGNRVTCRDWFQLSLKEGLTVFRDQEFSADMNSRAVFRIGDVRTLRSSQFLEDAGPMAHPVRPDSYVEINNFYTATVYNKGAEVVRMYQTLLGRDGFRKGMDLYFQRHDGQAVTTDDFFSAMMDANEISYSTFRRWYSQSGTPVINIKTNYDSDNKKYTITLVQSCQPTPGQDTKQPFLIPIKVGLLNQQGESITLYLEGDDAMQGQPDCTLLLAESSQQFVFNQIEDYPVLSILRDFSAPVKIDYKRDSSELVLLMAHDTDAFCRWEAGQEISSRAMVDLVGQALSGQELSLSQELVDAMAVLLQSPDLDPALIAEMMQLPSQTYLAEQFTQINVAAIFKASQFIYKTLGEAHYDLLLSLYKKNNNVGEYSLEPQAVAQREIKNSCLVWLMSTERDEVFELCFKQFENASNMTDSIAALRMLAQYDNPFREQALQTFYARWKEDVLVMDKWLSVQSISKRVGTFDEIKSLLTHPVFELSNPNKVRALLSSFCYGNPIHFHAENGEGYELAFEHIAKLDKLNPQVAASLLKSMTRWDRYVEPQKSLMKNVLQKVVVLPDLSSDCYEIASKCLNNS
ncbi:Membrane alanine aminopeptidase N [hydrothermal vent metagenome]|uniref:Membrane alanine aminopeptidase N n=1 Tax=hydrothermal vent metagenome TaxID=652676 RepID=A0A3B0Y1E1_9ZZZZ